MRLRKQYWIVIIYFGLLGGIPSLIRYLFPEFKYNFILSSVMHIIVFLLAIVIYYPLIYKKWLDFRAEEPRIWLYLLKCIGWLFLTNITVSLIRVVLSPWLSLDYTPANQLDLINLPLGKCQLFFFVVIFAPIVEELVFREAFLGHLDMNKKSHVYFTSLISIVFFAWMHATHPLDIFLYMPLAMTITLIYWHYKGNVVSSMVFHAVNNMIGYIIIILLPLLN